MNTTQQIKQLISKYGLDYETAGPCSCVCVQWDISRRAWRLYDDYEFEYVRSLAEAETTLREWARLLAEANEGM